MSHWRKNLQKLNLKFSCQTTSGVLAVSKNNLLFFLLRSWTTHFWYLTWRRLHKWRVVDTGDASEVLNACFACRCFNYYNIRTWWNTWGPKRLLGVIWSHRSTMQFNKKNPQQDHSINGIDTLKLYKYQSRYISSNGQMESLRRRDHPPIMLFVPSVYVYTVQCTHCVQKDGQVTENPFKRVYHNQISLYFIFLVIGSAWP